MILIEKLLPVLMIHAIYTNKFPSNEVPHYTDQLFFELQSKGFVPIIAHPERNKAISQNS